MPAETILLPVAKQILGKLGELASEQIGLVWTLRWEILKLKDTLSTIQAVLLDAQEKQTHNRQVKDWLEKLSDVMYDADDLLDDFSTEQAMAEADASRRTTTCWSMVCFLFSSLPKQLIYRVKMAHDIKAIREKLDDITKDKERLHLELRVEEVVLPLPWRETDSCPPMIVVGREDDKRNIIDLLLNSNSEASVSLVPIVGMGGLGKTTLAQLVFDDKKVEDHFDVHVWVYVSQSFDIKVILQKMLQSLSVTSQAGQCLDKLRGELRKELTGTRFLFVLDDVWEENDQNWQDLAKHLAVGAPGSKVMITTRSTKVAEVGGTVLKSDRTSSIVEPYLLKGLSLDESWSLLTKKAHPRRILQDPHVNKIGREILKRCYGVPLAVTMIAGLSVASKHPEIEWPLFLQKRLLDTAMKSNPIMAALQLSFNHLPLSLKHCFAYCRLYRKGHNFNVQRLVHFWVAQGYVESEDEGVGCFKMLLWRSFFHEAEMDEFGNISTCRMHDLMHDFADSIAENATSKTRHMALVKDEDAANLGVADGNKVRTLLCYNFISRPECERVFLNFKHLRVLMLLVDSVQIHSVSEVYRYLGFLSDGTEGVPNSITNLRNLRVFGVISTTLYELPRDIRKLVNLKHLYFESENITHMPKGIGELKLLQTLPFFVVGKKSSCNEGARLDELKELNALRGQLVITNLVDADSSIDVLRRKIFLQSLILDWGCDNSNNVRPSTRDEHILETLCPNPNLTKLEIVGGYRGVKIPNWLSTITNLVEILLENCRNCSFIPSLHRMPCLKKLTIINCPMLKGVNNYDGRSFQCLAYLLIKDCPMLTQLPSYPTVEGDLELVRASLEPLARTMKMLVRPLSKLTKLMLLGIQDDLRTLPDDDDLNGLGCLQELCLDKCCRGVKVPSSLCSSTSLTVIRVLRCETIEYLPPLHKLPSLMELALENCFELKGCWWKEDECWPQFPRLATLKIVQCPNLTMLPLFPTAVELELRRTSTRALIGTMTMQRAALCQLKCLKLWEIDDLESLPEDGLCNLTCLEELDIRSCSRLATLPPAMRQLCSIQSLNIRDCPRLTGRCRNEQGEDWINIRHIPNIFVGRNYVQLSGRSLYRPEEGDDEGALEFDPVYCSSCATPITKVVLRRRRRRIGRSREVVLFF